MKYLPLSFPQITVLVFLSTIEEDLRVTRSVSQIVHTPSPSSALPNSPCPLHISDLHELDRRVTPKDRLLAFFDGYSGPKGLCQNIIPDTIPF